MPEALNAGLVRQSRVNVRTVMTVMSPTPPADNSVTTVTLNLFEYYKPLKKSPPDSILEVLKDERAYEQCHDSGRRLISRLKLAVPVSSCHPWTRW